MHEYLIGRARKKKKNKINIQPDLPDKANRLEDST